MTRTKAPTPTPRPRKKQPKTATASLPATYPGNALTTDADLQGIIQRCKEGGKGYTLRELGQSRARALGFLSALLQHLTHSAALRACGLTWSDVSSFQAWSGDYGRLYDAVRAEVAARKLQVLEDEAFKWASGGKSKGIYHDGKRIDSEEAHSDKLHELLLRAAKPDVYGRAADPGNQQAVVINIDI